MLRSPDPPLPSVRPVRSSGSLWRITSAHTQQTSPLNSCQTENYVLETAGRARLLMHIDFAPRVLLFSPLFSRIIAAQQHSHLTALNVVIKVSSDGAYCLIFCCHFLCTGLLKKIYLTLKANLALLS